ncbi:MAG: OB-fold nucleic acid binding domain-containing protein, partial [Bacteroidota bacterium]
MYRSHTCGELGMQDSDREVTLSGWVHKVRDKGFVVWIDLRDRYGLTQLVFDEDRTPKSLLEQARGLGRETVIQVSGTVIERASKNPNMATGAIEVLVQSLL